MRPRWPHQLSKAAPRRHYKLLTVMYNPHLESLGCREIDRVQFMDLIRNKD
jgi:leucyl/phenylalanyl-tRNA--protein transferase